MAGGSLPPSRLAAGEAPAPTCYIPAPLIRAAATEFFASFDPDLRHVGEALVAEGVEEVLPKGAPVCRAGEVAGHFFYVHRGLLKHYVQRGRHEMTTWLSLPGDLAASFASMSTGTPSLETVSAVEETHVLRFGAAVLARAYAELPGADRLGRLITEHYFARMATRLYRNTLLSARDRYVDLLEQTPELLRDVPLGVLAGYLGMTQETLSRVRRQIAERRA